MTNGEYADDTLEKYSEIADKIREIIGASALPEASEVRAQTTVPKDLTSEQIEALYTVMEQTGFGRIEDRSLAEVGMLGAAVVIEGGRIPIKVNSELDLVLSTPEDHGPIVFSSTEFRMLDEKERTLLGLDEGSTEYDATTTLMDRQIGFAALEEPVALDFGYKVVVDETTDDSGEIHYAYRIEADSSHSSADHIGEINGQPVCRLKVERTYYDDMNVTDPAERRKFFQPDAGELAILAAQMLEANGATVDKVATVTGALYPTRDIGIAGANTRLAQEGNRLIVGVAMYGRGRAGEVTGTQPARPNEKQLISEVSRLLILLAQRAK